MPARPYPPNPLAGRGHVPNGRNASERAWVEAWLEPRRARVGRPAARRSATVPYGVRVRIRGRLTDERGRPIARAALAAVRREPGRPWRAVTGVRTRPDGRFTAFTRVGPSQELRFVYYAYGDSPHGRAARRCACGALALRLRVPPPPGGGTARAATRGASSRPAAGRSHGGHVRSGFEASAPRAWNFSVS